MVCSAPIENACCNTSGSARSVRSIPLKCCTEVLVNPHCFGSRYEEKWSFGRIGGIGGVGCRISGVGGRIGCRINWDRNDRAAYGCIARRLWIGCQQTSIWRASTDRPTNRTKPRAVTLVACLQTVESSDVTAEHSSTAITHCEIPSAAYRGLLKCGTYVLLLGSLVGQETVTPYSRDTRVARYEKYVVSVVTEAALRLERRWFFPHRCNTRLSTPPRPHCFFFLSSVASKFGQNCS